MYRSWLLTRVSLLSRPLVLNVALSISPKSLSLTIAEDIRTHKGDPLNLVRLLNLTNAPLRYYEGATSRPIQQEYYRSWVTFGVKFNF